MKKIDANVCYFYLPDSALNDATRYYCDLVKSACERLGLRVKSISTENFDTIDENSLTFTIRLVDYLKICKYSNFNIFWFQGVVPEEIRLLRKKGIKNRLLFYYTSYKENVVLTRATINIFVSEAMKTHYERKYKLKILDNYAIIPCYNQQLKLEAFNFDKKYTKLDFVYAGSISSWQCVEESLQIFKIIQQQEEAATFTVLTNQKEEIYKLIKRYDLKNVVVDYVALDQLQNYLSKFKYAFLLRENNVVNNVSTPTKMNSYLASGVIPIYTDVIESFESNIRLDSFGVKVSLENDNHNKIARKILEHHNKRINLSDILHCYQELFTSYYSDERYIRNLELLLEKKWQLR